MASKKRSSPPASASSKSVRSKKKPQRSAWLNKTLERSAVNKGAYKATIDAIKLEVSAKPASPPIGPPAQLAANKRGKPTIYTKKMGETFFELVSTGHSLDSIAARSDMPSLGPLLRWIGDEAHPFSDFYIRGKKLLVPLFEERMALAAVDPEQFTIIVKKSGTTAAGPVDTVEERVIDNTARSALKMQAYQWTLSHLMPKKHGRTPELGGGGPNEQLEGLFASLKSGPANE